MEGDTIKLRGWTFVEYVVSDFCWGKLLDVFNIAEANIVGASNVLLMPAELRSGSVAARELAGLVLLEGLDELKGADFC